MALLPVTVLGLMPTACCATKTNMPSDTIAVPSLLYAPTPPIGTVLSTLTVSAVAPGGTRPAITPSSLSSRSRAGEWAGTSWGWFGWDTVTVVAVVSQNTA